MHRLRMAVAMLGVAALTGGHAAAQSDDAQEGENVAFLGVFGADITADSGMRGALIQEVVADGPAAKAGLRSGDVVLKVGDRDVDGFNDLARILRQRNPGEKAALTILREGVEEVIEVELGGRPAAPQRPQTPFDLRPDGFRFQIPGQEGRELPFEFPDAQRQPAAPRPMIGIQLQPLDDALRNRLQLGDRQGVVIAEVVEDGPAAKAGLQSTDVILQADGQAIDSPEDLVRIVSEKKAEDELTLQIFRDGQTLEKTLVVEEMTPPQRRFRLPPGVTPDQIPEQFRRFLPPVEPDARRGPDGPRGPGRAQRRNLERRIQELEEQVQQLRNELNELRESRKQSAPEDE